jgi:hypothetical protein
MTRVRLSWRGGEVTANLQQTLTVKQVLAILPRESRACTWGEEVYFELPVKATLEADARQVVEPGTVCFWVEGNALALPYGRTPASQGAEPRLVSPCNVLGKIEGDPRQLAKIRAGDAIRVELLPEKA